MGNGASSPRRSAAAKYEIKPPAPETVASLETQLSAAATEVLTAAEEKARPDDLATAVALRLLMHNSDRAGGVALGTEALRALDGDDQAEGLRRALFGCARTIKSCQEHLEREDTQHARNSTRSSYLISLVELIGPQPAHDWRDEWVALNQETARMRGWNVPSEADLTGDGKFAIKTKLKTYKHQVAYKCERGWFEEDAMAHVALSGVCDIALAASIRRHSPSFAASVHALYNALARASSLETELPKPCYCLINNGRGGGLAVDVDEQFAALSIPDANGFRGFSCAGEIYAYGDGALDKMFPGDGRPPRVKVMKHGVEYYLEVPEGGRTDVIAIIPKMPDESGRLHSPVHTTKDGYRVPPNSLVTFKRYHKPGEWVAANGVRPRCGCYDVTVTFHPPKMGAPALQRAETSGNNKMTAAAQTLNYADRRTYARGLRELEGPLSLTMEQEWLRDERWKAHDGSHFSAALEYAYARGTAGQVPRSRSVGEPPISTEGFLDTFAGRRDELNAGVTLQDFVERANAYVHERAAIEGLPVEPSLHLLDREEVLSLRLYTGPGYQVINNFLREMGKLSESMRARLARAPELTYAQTVVELCSAIRKLARVNPNLRPAARRKGEEGAAPTRTLKWSYSQEGLVSITAADAEPPAAAAEEAVEDDEVRWRGVRGTLPAAFFSPGELGLVVATELGMMSTSMAMDTPLHYMQYGGANVLWELHTSPEDERGYHQGADVSMVSQFPAEKEELFPPLTMLSVVQRPHAHEREAPSRFNAVAQASTKSLVDRWLRAVEEGKDSDDEDEDRPGAAWLSSEALEEFCREWEAKVESTEDGKEYLRITVEPTFV